MTTSPPPILPPIHTLHHYSAPSTPTFPPPPAHPASEPAFSLNSTMDINSVMNPEAPQPPTGPPAMQREERMSDDDHYDEDDDEDAIGDDDDDDSDDGRIPMEPHELYPWRPIMEDKSVPCDDEIKFIESKEEHSAVDHEYWQKETFKPLDDPDLKPTQSGRIEWLVEHFNGTKEKPNKQLIMKSAPIRIGGLDWQIKLYPKGNRAEYLSVYLECISMQSNKFVDSIDFPSPPLPVLNSSTKLKRRVSIAAQFSVIMYNPAEPRVYEYKIDSTQFHRQVPDFGWKYFSQESRHDLPLRKHGQRQAMLRNDQLAFVAHIRLVDDPTGCMWDNTAPPADPFNSPTGLRPFDGTTAQLCAITLLFHLPIFRTWLYKAKTSNGMILFLQVLLAKFLTRTLKKKHVNYSALPQGPDVIAVLQAIRTEVAKDAPGEVVTVFDDMFAGFNPYALPICHNRLKSNGCSSVQEAVSRQPLSCGPYKPQILTIELERQRFSKSKRKWEKISNAVRLNDKIVMNGGTDYFLYAFVTHSGPLGNNHFTAYVRPGGQKGHWYGYEYGRVTCYTAKAALEKHGGVSNSGKSSPPKTASYGSASYGRGSSKHGPGIAYLAMYVRSDVASEAFSMPRSEKWTLPDVLKKNAKVERPSRFDNVKTNVIVEKELPPSIDERKAWATMDGDDVIMSDVEEEMTRPNIASTLSANIAARSAPLSDPPHLSKKVINHYGGEYFDGYTLADGTFQGEGHHISTSGDEYKGHFRAGQRHGGGQMVYSSTGNKYTGDWVDGQHHGRGVLVEKQTGNVFEGGFKEGRRHGAFTLRGTVTDDDKNYCQICYEKEMTTAFYDCGHVLACKQCAAQVDVCPVCRKQVLARLELFGVKISMT